MENKGKRVRPILTLMAADSLANNHEKALPAALAIEIFHNFSLVHDDIMDNDSKRHGQPSVHYKWDIPTAILAGDGLFTLAQLSLVGLDGHIFQRFNEVALDVCEGQGMDKEYESDHTVEMENYIQMIGKKTASFLGMCSELGAVLGKASKQESDNLFQFGYYLGLAFQIKDDYLEIFGNEESMGKSLGSDLDEDKQTILALVARKNNSKEWANFRQNSKNFEDYKNYFESNGIKKEVENLIELNVEKALTGLDMISPDKSNQLTNYAKLILNREF